MLKIKDSWLLIHYFLSDPTQKNKVYQKLVLSIDVSYLFFLKFQKNLLSY